MLPLKTRGSDRVPEEETVEAVTIDPEQEEIIPPGQGETETEPTEIPEEIQTVPLILFLILLLLSLIAYSTLREPSELIEEYDRNPGFPDL